MKYRKREAKEYARTVLKGVWTALPYNFTEDDQLDEAAALAKHAQATGFDFVIILTPYIAVRSGDAVYEYYRFVAERVDIGIILFNIPQTYYPISERLAKRLATISNICGFKQAGPAPTATILLREAIGK